MLTPNLKPIGTISDAQFTQLCQANPELKLERTPAGDLVLISPTGGETGRRNFEIAADFAVWNRRQNLGYCFDSSTCFRLPSGGDRSPDLAWIAKPRWDALSPAEQAQFPPIAPDFVLELRSPSDALTTLQAKMQEYLASGVRLGWLIDCQQQRVEVYRLGAIAPIILTQPATLAGEPVLPGLVLNVGWLWRSGN